MEFSRLLLEREKVGVVPGVAFGGDGEGWVRVTLAAQDDVLAEGVDRLGRFVARLTDENLAGRR